MSALKDIYSPQFYEKLSDVLSKTVPYFDKKDFVSKIFTDNFNQMELKERMRHTTKVLHKFMPEDFGKAVKVIEKTIDELSRNNIGEDSLAFIFFPDYIEIYGLEDYENSVKAIEFTTQFISCEFGIRPFIIKYFEPIMSQLLRWSKHENHKVRRLATEGCRPRLPWAMALPELKKNPEKIIPILENLKNDSSDFVRRSVANNLNDIAKDHPKIILEIAKKWKNTSKETDAIIKHGCRTLLKQGHPEILSHYGLDSTEIEVTNFKVDTLEVKVPDALQFSFEVENKYEIPKIVRLEYAIYYNKANGLLSKKVFKISEKLYQTKQKVLVVKKQSFKLITTKKFYSGLHKVSIIANGKEKIIGDFQLVT
jgi:3-methyladenine DNA glycosylase AlkC